MKGNITVGKEGIFYEKVANNLLKSFSYLAKGVKFIGNMIIKKATRYNGESWATAIMRFVRKDLGLVV